jgi:hypothetical protein
MRHARRRTARLRSSGPSRSGSSSRSSVKRSSSRAGCRARPASRSSVANRSSSAIKALPRQRTRQPASRKQPRDKPMSRSATGLSQRAAASGGCDGAAAQTCHTDRLPAIPDSTPRQPFDTPTDEAIASSQLRRILPIVARGASPDAARSPGSLIVKRADRESRLAGLGANGDGDVQPGDDGTRGTSPPASTGCRDRPPRSEPPPGWRARAGIFSGRGIRASRFAKARPRRSTPNLADWSSRQILWNESLRSELLQPPREAS